MSRKTILKKPILVLVVVILVCGAFALAGCGSDSGQADTAAGNTAATAEGSPSVGGSKGNTAPDFTLEKIHGGELQLSSLRGKAVIIDFWDTWCPPCRKAMPHLQELSETYSDDLVVVGVAMGREGADKVRSFTKDFGLTFEMVLLNNNGKVISDFGGIQSIPTTFLIDRDGVIQEKWVGAFDLGTYEKAVKAVIGS